MMETNTSRSATRPPDESDQDVPPETSEPSANGAAPATAAVEREAAAPRETPAIFTKAVREPGIPEASPDGSWLAYLYPGDDGGRELWLSPLSGDDAIRLDVPFRPVDDLDPDTGRYIRGPQWSPDGKTLAVTGMHPDGDRTAVWLVALEPGEVASAASDVVTNAGADASHPDAAAEADDSGTEALQTDERAESDETGPESADNDNQADPAPAPTPVAPTVLSAKLLCDHPWADRSPRWSLDGMLMLVVTTRNGVDQIGLAQPGLEDVPPMIEPITSGVLSHREPMWSRDGRFIAFTRQHGDDYRFADICVFEPQTGEYKNLTAEKTPSVRHTLDWVPGRNLVSFVTRDGDWLGISVINADNKAGWMVTREAGDKYGQRFAPDEARLVYVRSEGFSTVLAERGLHGSGAVAIDPGEGVVSTPVWVADKKVVYGFSAPQKPFGWLMQATSADAERAPVALPELVLPRDAQLRHPVPFEYDVGPEEQFSGLVYQTDELSGPVPGVVYVPEGPLTARLAEFQRDEQALASTGFTVLTPVLHGANGFGTAVEDDLADYGEGELEAADLTAAGQALGEREGVDASKLALIGNGYGGTLAMIAAGARPGVFGTVVAVDPVADWTAELDQADHIWRQWVTRQYGLPLTHADRYALRSPETFAGVIDADLLLVSTAGASASRKAQFGEFVAWLDEVGVTYTRVDLDATRSPAALYEIARLLASRLRTPETAE